MTGEKENNSADVLCTLTPVAIFRSPLEGKFGIPRQAGLAGSLRGRIVLEPPFRHPDALRGLDGFDYLWLIWGFSLNSPSRPLLSSEAAPPSKCRQSRPLPLTPSAGPSLLRTEGGYAFEGGLPPHPSAGTVQESAAIPLEGAQGVEYYCQPTRLTVRPPRLGGNERVGVFASRSPFRPNGLGLSSVRIESVDFENGIINVLGADLADGTPIYDIKPYVTYTDSHPEARSGFVDSNEWERLEVIIPDTLAAELGPELTEGLTEVLAEDPRPQYQKNSGDKIYGLTFAGRNIRFKVSGTTLEVITGSELTIG